MENIRPKPLREIESQSEKVKQTLGVDLTPEGIREELFDLPLDELKRRYPERYRIFVETIRAIRNTPEQNLDSAIESSAIKANAFIAMEKELDDPENSDLLERQLETLHKTSTALERGITRGYVSLPTGVGKTVIFSRIISAYATNPNAKILVVSPTKLILHQNDSKVDDWSGVETGKYYGGGKDKSKQVTMTTYNSFMGQAEDLGLESYDLIILDESHRALSEARVSQINTLKHPTIIGFTATPEFHENKRLEDILDYEIDSMSIKEAVEEGLLSSMKVYMVHTSASMEGVDVTGKQYDTQALTKSIDTPHRNELVVRTYAESPVLSGKRAVAYCVTQDHAKRIAGQFNEKGISAAYIGGDCDDSEREMILKRYKDGDIKVICCADLLIEGFDETEAEVCLNVTPTISKVVAEQRGGRVLRRSRVNSRKVGIIVEFIDDWKDSTEKPILFSEVAKAAELNPIKIPSQTEKIPELKENKPQSNPEKGPDLLISDPELIMKVTHKHKTERLEYKYKYAPREWSHSKFISKETHVGENSIQRYAGTYRLSNPEWFKKHLTAHDRLVEHYAPELTYKIRRRFLTEIQDKINAAEFAKRQHIDVSYVRDLFTQVLEERKDIPAIGVGGDVYIDDTLFSIWMKNQKEAKESRKERKEKIALNKLLENENDPIVQKEYTEIVDDSPTFDELGNEYDGTEEIAEEDMIKDEERELFRKMLIDNEKETNNLESINISSQELEVAMEKAEKIDPVNVIVIRMMFFGNSPITLEQAGKKLGITREAVRARKGKALKKIREALRIKSKEVKDAESKALEATLFRATVEGARESIRKQIDELSKIITALNKDFSIINYKFGWLYEDKDPVWVKIDNMEKYRASLYQSLVYIGGIIEKSKDKAYKINDFSKKQVSISNAANLINSSYSLEEQRKAASMIEDVWIEFTTA